MVSKMIYDLVLGFASPNNLMYVARFLFTSCDPRGPRVTQNTYFSLYTHTKQLLLVTVCDKTARIGSWTGRMTP